jgi:hypothetical protein
MESINTDASAMLWAWTKYTEMAIETEIKSISEEFYVPCSVTEA